MNSHILRGLGGDDYLIGRFPPSEGVDGYFYIFDPYGVTFEIPPDSGKKVIIATEGHNVLQYTGDNEAVEKPNSEPFLPAFSVVLLFTRSRQMRRFIGRRWLLISAFAAEPAMAPSAVPFRGSDCPADQAAHCP